MLCGTDLAFEHHLSDVELVAQEAGAPRRRGRLGETVPSPFDRQGVHAADKRPGEGAVAAPGATDVGVRNRRPVRGRCGPFLVRVARPKSRV
jgi:hypothetical protein